MCHSKTPCLTEVKASILRKIASGVSNFTQYQAPSSVENHEAAIWLMMVEAGCLPPEDAPDLLALRRRLTRTSRGMPPMLKLRYRHAIQETDEFVMELGYTNFPRVQK